MPWTNSNTTCKFLSFGLSKHRINVIQEMYDPIVQIESTCLIRNVQQITMHKNVAQPNTKEETLCTYIYYLKFLALGVTINIHVIYIWSSNMHTKPPLSACKLKASDFLQCFGNFGKTLLLLTVTGHKMTSKKLERFYIC